MRRTWAIAKVGYKECLRYRIIYFIFAMAVVFILMGKGCNPGTIKGKGLFFDDSTLFNMAMSVAFHGIAFWSLLLCNLLASFALLREFEEGTAILTLSRPLSKSSFISGKLLSILIISVLNLFLLGALFFVLFYFDAGWFNYRLFISFSCMVLGLLLFALLSMFLSLFLPRLMTPLVCVIIYFASVWAALPFHVEKLKIVWEPSETVHMLYRYLPPLGDLQFIGAALISETPAFSDISGTLLSVGVYCVALWFAIVFFFSRKQV